MLWASVARWHRIPRYFPCCTPFYTLVLLPGGKIDGDINKGGYISIDMGYTHGRHGGIFTGIGTIISRWYRKLDPTPVGLQLANRGAVGH